MNVKNPYELIDCGEYQKLERFGDIIIIRPAPHAYWKRRNEEDWKQADAIFNEKEKRWVFKSPLKDEYSITIENINFILRFSKNGQIGLFPEQLKNWLWLKDITYNSERNLKILNTFSYTGASTLFCALHNRNDNEITHLEGSSSIIKWAKDNAYSNPDYKENIRWINDDVITFMEKEIRREKHYNGIILDPPAFGRSGKKTWKLHRDLNRLFQLTGDLLKKDPEFLIFSCHSEDLKISDVESMFKHLSFIDKGIIETMDLIIESEKGNDLPSGICVRWQRSH